MQRTEYIAICVGWIRRDVKILWGCGTWKTDKINQWRLQVGWVWLGVRKGVCQRVFNGVLGNYMLVIKEKPKVTVGREQMEHMTKTGS